MRKVLLSLLFAIAAITGSAQTTYNVRVGFGTVHYQEYSYEHTGYGGSCAFQANIPVNTYKTLTISPTLSLAYEDVSFWSLPVYLGYKISKGRKSILFPKIGPVIAVSDEFMCGLSTEFAWEYSHFVIAANYFYIKDGAGNDYSNGFNLTLGYKF